MVILVLVYKLRTQECRAHSTHKCPWSFSSMDGVRESPHPYLILVESTDMNCSMKNRPEVLYKQAKVALDSLKFVAPGTNRDHNHVFPWVPRRYRLCAHKAVIFICFDTGATNLISKGHTFTLQAFWVLWLRVDVLGLKKFNSNFKKSVSLHTAVSMLTQLAFEGELQTFLWKIKRMFNWSLDPVAFCRIFLIRTEV